MVAERGGARGGVVGGWGIVPGGAGRLAGGRAPAATTPARTSAPATTRATVTTPSPSPTPTPTPAAVTVTRQRMKDGSVVTIATFSGPVRYVLHDGSVDPGLAAGHVKAGPAGGGPRGARLGGPL